RTGHGRQIGAELVVGGKGGHAVVVELQAEHLPGIALQRCQAPVEEQPARHALMAVAAVEEAVGDWRGALRRLLRLKVPQRLVEHRRQCNRTIAPWCAARGHGDTSLWSIQFRIADQITDIGRLIASARSMVSASIAMSSLRATWRSATPAFQRSHKATSCASSSTGCRPLRLGSPRMPRRSATS